MLKNYYPYEYAKSVFEIDYKKLYNLGYKAIIFDIDNTLVHHGEDSTPEVDALFREIHSTGLKTILLSNNTDERIERFIRNIDTPYIYDAHKPDTSGFFKAIEMLGVKKEEAVVIGDTTFTDIYGANKSGIASILVKFLQHESETKIGKKRQLEKIILKFYGMNKSCRNRIGDIFKEEDAENALEQK